MDYQSISVAPLSGAMGAEISGVDLSKNLSNQVFTEIHQALLENLVIVFHDQSLTPEACKLFAQKFGKLVKYPFVEGLHQHPEIFEIRKEPDEKKILEVIGTPICLSRNCLLWVQCCIPSRSRQRAATQCLQTYIWLMKVYLRG